MALRPVKISKTLMYWVALQKKEFISDYEPPVPPVPENVLTEIAEDLLTESGEVLTT